MKGGGRVGFNIFTDDRRTEGMQRSVTICCQAWRQVGLSDCWSRKQVYFPPFGTAGQWAAFVADRLLITAHFAEQLITYLFHRTIIPARFYFSGQSAGRGFIVEKVLIYWCAAWSLAGPQRQGRQQRWRWKLPWFIPGNSWRSDISSWSCST